MFVLKAGCLLVAMASVVQSCCMPAEFEGNIGMAMGYIENGTGHYIEGYLRLAFDANNLITVTDQSLNADGKAIQQRVITDYKTNFTYTVTAEGCKKAVQTTPWPGRCLPETSYANTYHYGLNALETKAYMIQVGQYTVYIAVTADTCVPIAEDILSDKVMQTLTYTGVSTGIKDRSVFAIPRNCPSVPTGPLVNPIEARRSFVV